MLEQPEELAQIDPAAELARLAELPLEERAARLEELANRLDKQLESLRAH